MARLSRSTLVRAPSVGLYTPTHWEAHPIYPWVLQPTDFKDKFRLRGTAVRGICSGKFPREKT